jgi:hypothetical protein
VSDTKLIEAVLQLKKALRHDLIDLEYIKVNRLPVIDGKEVESIAGVSLRTVIYEDEADAWRRGE